METEEMLAYLQGVSQTAGLNRWLDVKVISASAEGVEIAIPWKDEAGQYAGFLHAGIIAALIDTACGFAAAVQVGRVLASHFSVSCLAPAVGSRFIARARVRKAGKRQIFASAELFAEDELHQEKLVATGETLLLRVVEP